MINKERYEEKKILLEQAADSLDNAIGINTPLDGELKDLLFGVQDAIQWLKDDYPEYE